MASRLKKYKEWLGRFRRVKPLVSSRHDVTLLRNMKRRKIPSLGQVIRIRKILSAKEFILLILSITLFVISAAWLFSDAAKKYRIEIPRVAGEYTEGVVGSPYLLNPIFSVDDVDVDIVKLVYSGLLRYDNTQRLVPDLAAKYEVSEDKTEYTFYLRQDVVWHDNEPFTVDDVIFTFETLKETDTGSPLLVSFQGVVVEKVDDYTVRFILESQFSSFLSSLTTGIIPEHIWQSIPPDQMRLAKRNLQPIGTGPFSFKSLIKDESGFIKQVELEHFEKYYREVPFIKNFTFLFFTEYEGSKGVVDALREQKVDGLNFVPFRLREKIKRKHINLYTLQLPQYSALFFNSKRNSALENKEIRLALAQALDKERIVGETLSNEGKIVYGPILEGFPGFNGDIEKIKYSAEEANNLLDKEWTRISADEYKDELRKGLLEERAGSVDTENTTVTSTDDEVTKNSTSTDQVSTEVIEEIDQAIDAALDESQLFYRKNEDGTLLEMDLVSADTPEYRHVTELVAGYWQSVGVKTNITLVPSKDISREVLRERNYDVLLYGVIVGEDPDQYAFWHSSQVENPGLNLSGLESRQVDDLLEEVRGLDNEEELAQKYSELQDKILENIPAIFLYTPTYTYALSDKVKGFDVERISRPSDRFSQVTQWYIKTKSIWK